METLECTATLGRPETNRLIGSHGERSLLREPSSANILQVPHGVNILIKLKVLCLGDSNPHGIEGLRFQASVVRLAVQT